jgi:molybdenum cofactor cytidylyltransferase
MKLACVVLAAGSSVRFGGNKLNAVFCGRSLFERTLSAVPLERFGAAVVVTQYDELAEKAEKVGFLAVRNPDPSKGISLSVRLGLEKVREESDAVMFMVADQPMLTKVTLERLLDIFERHPGRIVAPAFEGRRGNPVIFPKEFFEELAMAEGDSGGRGVIEAHRDKLFLMPLSDCRELFDVDTREQLKERRFGNE